jgi:putative ABC transport system permease protein
LIGAEVSASLFPLLQTKPRLGRTFLGEEEAPEKNQVVLLSHKLWQSRFAANPDVIGKSIRLDGHFFTVVGIMPPTFEFPNEAEFWTPLTVTNDGSNATLKVLARLKPGVSLERAQTEAVLIARRLDEQHRRDMDSHVKTSLIPLETAVGLDSRAAMFILLGAVGLLLLIACVNVANLLLARSATRSQEIAIRNALGATRWRIIRQLITESALLTGLGAALGLLLAYASRGALISATLSALPKNLVAARIATATIDHSVLLFTLALSVLTGILFGLAPILQGSGVRPNGALKTASQNVAGSLARGRLREVLVVSEIALAFVLLSGAGLLLRSFLKLIAINPGFEPRNVLSMNLELPESRYQTPAQMIAFEQQSLEKLQAIPGVQSAGSVFGLPLGDILIRGDFVVEGQPAPPADASPAKILIGGDYFNTIGIPLLAGRTFNSHDSSMSPPVVIVSQTFARRFWPNQDAIGRRLKLGFSRDPWCTVVGVVGDVRQFDLQDESALAFYMPYAQSPIPLLMQSLTFVVRYSSGDPLATANAARHAITAVDPDVPLFDVASMEQLVYRSLSEPRFNTSLLASFGVLALLLAALGTYGVMSCAVTARTSEIGVRIALGASRQDVLRQILGRVILLTATGLALGFLGAALTSRFLENQLYHVQPTDLATYFVVSTLMLIAASLAGYIPARRAAQVDPMVALRYE